MLAMTLQGSCLSTLLCSLFLADLESSHLQDLLPRASWHPCAHMHPQATLRPTHIGPTPTSSSTARLTDLAEAAATGTQLPPNTRSAQQCMGTFSWQEVQPQVSSADVDCGSGQGDQWLTQQMQSAHDAFPLTGLREALAGTESATAQSAATQSGGSQGAAHNVWSASAAPCQSPVNTDWLRHSADHQLNTKRPRRSLSNQQPAQAGGDLHQQAAAPSRDAAASAAGLDRRQQGSMRREGGQRNCCPQGGMACEEDQQTPQQGQPGNLEDHEEQSQPCDIEVSKDATQQSPTKAAGLRRGVERRAPRLQSLLIRLIDDFLFITPSRTAAEALVNKLLKGAQLTAHCHPLFT